MCVCVHAMYNSMIVCCRILVACGVYRERPVKALLCPHTHIRRVCYTCVPYYSVYQAQSISVREDSVCKHVYGHNIITGNWEESYLNVCVCSLNE